MEMGQTLKLVMLIALGILSAAYIFRWVRNVLNDCEAEPSSPESRLPSLGQGALGFVTNFFDTLGIGSFATTTAVFKLLRMVRDEYIPGTLLAGLTLPSLVLFSLLGMDPHAAFPIMAGAAAFTGLTAGIRVLDLRRYDFRAALGLTLGGIPGVLLAAFVVKSLPLNVLRWLVVVVIVYTAAMMLRTAYAEWRTFTTPIEQAPFLSEDSHL